MSTDFLFSRPTFLSGVARSFDLWGSFHSYNISRTSQEADVIALVHDWLATEADLRCALSTLLSDDADLTMELDRVLHHPEAATATQAQEPVPVP